MRYNGRLFNYKRSRDVRRCAPSYHCSELAVFQFQSHQIFYECSTDNTQFFSLCKLHVTGMETFHCCIMWLKMVKKWWGTCWNQFIDTHIHQIWFIYFVCKHTFVTLAPFDILFGNSTVSPLSTVWVLICLCMSQYVMYKLTIKSFAFIKLSKRYVKTFPLKSTDFFYIDRSSYNNNNNPNRVYSCKNKKRLEWIAKISIEYSRWLFISQHRLGCKKTHPMLI